MRARAAMNVFRATTASFAYSSTALSARVCPAALGLSSRRAPLACPRPQRRAYRFAPARRKSPLEGLSPEEREKAWLEWREKTIRETLAAAYSDGLLHGDFEHAVQIAKECAVNLSEEHITGNAIPYLLKVANNDASLLAKICLVLMRDIHARTDVNVVLHGLTYYREPLSVIWAVQGLLRREVSYFPQNLTESLAEIAHQGKIPQAVVLYGRMLQAQGRDHEAIAYFRKAVALSKPVPRQFSLDSLFSPLEPQPWECLGGALAELEGTQEGLLPCLLDGALVYDHSRAYHALGRAALHKKEYRTAEENLMKSAMAGNFEDSYYLGVLHLRKALVFSERLKRSPFDNLPRLDFFINIPFIGQLVRIGAFRNCIMDANYWLGIGYEAGNPKASLAYACLLHKWVPNGHERALKVLMDVDEAAAEKGLADRLCSQWSDPHLGFNYLLDLARQI